MSIDHMAFIWLVILVVLLLIEIGTLGLTTIWFAGGALIAFISSYFGIPFIAQFIVFLVVSFAMLFIFRPTMLKKYNKNLLKTNVQSVIGQEVKIIEEVNNDEMTGMAILNGQEWTVRSETDDVIIKSGEKVKIVEVRGVKLIVAKIKEEKECQ